MPKAAHSSLKKGYPCGARVPKARGQVTVEILLVLPIFMLMLFFIMELGNIAYQTILYNHCAYELARIGSLVAGPPGGAKNAKANLGTASAKMGNVLSKMKVNCSLTPAPYLESTGADPQVSATGGKHINEDLVVSLTCTANLVFPGANYFLADPPRYAHQKRIKVVVRMPVEKPIFQ